MSMLKSTAYEISSFRKCLNIYCTLHSTGRDSAKIQNFGQIDMNRSRNGKSAVEALRSYEGRSICNENSTVHPKGLYLRTS